MKILDQLDDLNLDAAAKTQVAALVQALLDQVKKDAEHFSTKTRTSGKGCRVQAKAADIQSKDLKIQALILELAHLRRLRYGVKNEALSGLQRDLFEESCNEDIAALEAEVEHWPATKPVPPLPNPNVPARVVSPCPSSAAY